MLTYILKHNAYHTYKESRSPNLVRKRGSAQSFNEGVKLKNPEKLFIEPSTFYRPYIIKNGKPFGIQVSTERLTRNDILRSIGQRPRSRGLTDNWWMNRRIRSSNLGRNVQTISQLGLVSQSFYWRQQCTITIIIIYELWKIGRKHRQTKTK